MAILKIARMGHPVLRRPARPVADPRDPEMRHLVENMIETMADAEGLGLAAPQVHVPWRVVIFHIPAERAGEEDARELTVLFNPVVEPVGEEMELGWEGCLSVPGLRGLVPRYTSVRYRGLDGDGQPIERLARDLHARVVQHECDHLDGILYPMRMPDLSLLVFESELKRMLLGEDEEEAASAVDESAVIEAL